MFQKSRIICPTADTTPYPVIDISMCTQYRSLKCPDLTCFKIWNSLNIDTKSQEESVEYGPEYPGATVKMQTHKNHGANLPSGYARKV